MTKAIKISVFLFLGVFCQTRISFSRETLEKLIYSFKNNFKIAQTRISLVMGL